MENRNSNVPAENENYDVILATDADGCIYNIYLRFLYLFFYKKYGKKIFKYVDHSLDEQAQKTVNRIFADILLELEKIVSYDVDEKKYSIENYSDEEYQNLCCSIVEDAHFDPNTEAAEKFLNLKIRRFLAAIEKLGREDVLEAFLHQANLPFFHDMVWFCKDDCIQRFKLMCASARQTSDLDQHNSERNGTDLFFKDLPRLRNIFHQSYEFECELDDFKLENIFSEETFFYDETKFFWLYVILNRIPTNRNTILIIRDDREDIIEGLKKILSTHPDVVNKKIKVVLWPYAGKPSELFVIEGTGQYTDKNYAKNIFQIKAKWNTALRKQENVPAIVDDMLTRGVINAIKKAAQENLQTSNLAQFSQFKQTPVSKKKSDDKKEKSRKCTLV